MVLFVNACVRGESRTKRLADAVLERIGDEVTELRLWEMEMPAVDEAFIARRDAAIEKNDFSDPVFGLARQFAAADTIVIAAPYWDLSFPASLKQYIEQVSVVGISFTYSETGIPKGMCAAGKLYYVTTSGGRNVPAEFGAGYIEALARGLYGIGDFEAVSAEGLDIYGEDAEAILAERIRLVKQ